MQEHSDVPNEQVGRFVFQDLAEVNEAASSTVEEVTQLGELCSCTPTNTTQWQRSVLAHKQAVGALKTTSIWSLTTGATILRLYMLAATIRGCKVVARAQGAAVISQRLKPHSCYLYRHRLSAVTCTVHRAGPPIPNIVGDYFNICPHTAGTRDIPHIPSGTYACLVTGTQQIAKSREGPEQSNKVFVLLCVIRLPQYQADLLISVNAPTYINASSSSADHASQPGPQPEAEVQAKAVMQGLLQDLEIADEGLFG